MAFLISADGDINSTPRFSWEPKWPAFGLDSPIEESIWFKQKHGVRILPEWVPEKAILKTSHRHLSDYLSPTNDTVLVSDKIKSIWEHFGPGEVEYIPIDLVHKNGEPASSQRYYFINVLKRLDAIDWAASNLILDKYPTPRGFRDVKLPKGYPDTEFDITISRQARVGIAIWGERDAGAYSSWVFVSDDVAGTMHLQNISGVIYQVVKEK